MTSELHPGEINDPKQALDFMLGGNATFTIKSSKTGARYTYKVRQFEEPECAHLFFVSYLTGQDNENDFSYLCLIDRGKIRLTKKSKLKLDSLPVRAINWTLQHISLGRFPPNLEFWHVGKCGKCGRTLTVPESLTSGFGPECRKRINNGVSAVRSSNFA